MIGIDYLQRLEQILNDSHPAGYWVDKKTSFDFLYEAAKDFQKETGMLHGTQSITMIPYQTNYALMPSYMGMYVGDSYGDKVIKFYDGDNTNFINWVDYGDVVYDNETTPQTVPGSYAVIDRTLTARVTGTTTSAGVHANGESVLTSTTSSFANVEAGDAVYNTTSSYQGIVLSKTSNTALVTAMFDMSAIQSAYASWGSGDAFVIQPQPRYDLVINPPPDGLELLTVNATPAPDTWSAGATLTGAVSGETCVVVEALTATTYNVKLRSGTFTLGEIISDGTNLIDCSATYPTFTGLQIATVNYIQRPDPVYSDFGSYRFPTGYEEALLKYAVWLYKYRDQAPQFGDALYKYYDMQVRKAKNVHRKSVGAVGFKVNYIKR